MRTWTIRYKWASGTGVVGRINPPVDVHGGHEAVTTVRTARNVKPTRTRIRRAIVADLTRDDLHHPSFAWRIKRKISVTPRR
jgi:hypothetical protein